MQQYLQAAMQLGQGLPVNAGGEQLQRPEPVTLDALHSLLQQALAHASVSDYQQQLQRWDEEARPNYFLCLLQILAHPELQEDVRLLAAVLLKNFCGAAPQKRVSNQSWTRIPEEERSNLKAHILLVLAAETSERIITQIILLIANVAAYDFPRRWPTLVEELLAWAQPPGGMGQDRPDLYIKAIKANRALKFIGRALAERRVTFATFDDSEMPGTGYARSGQALRGIIQDATLEKQMTNEAVSSCVSRLISSWSLSFQAFQASEYRDMNSGEVALTCLSALDTMYLATCTTMSHKQNPPKPDLRPLLEAVSIIARLIPQEKGQDEMRRSSLGMCSRMFEKVSGIIYKVINYQTELMGPHYFELLKLYLDHALLSVSAADIENMRPKRPEVMLRVIGSCLIATSLQDLRGPDTKGNIHDQDQIDKFLGLVKDMCGGPGTVKILASLLSKYLIITESQLKQWQEEPEEYVQTATLSYGSSERQSCGLGLLEQMLSTSHESVLAAIKELANGLENAPPSPASVLLQEAGYLAIGYAMSLPLRQMNMSRQAEDIGKWYQASLRQRIDNPTKPEDAAVEYRALRCRALWVIMVNDLPRELQCDAIDLVAKNLEHRDIVVALQAVSTLTAIFQSTVRKVQAISIDGVFGTFPLVRLVASHLEGQAQAFEEVVQHVANISASFLQSLLSLQKRLEEVDSQTQVFNLVSLLLELVGKRSQDVVLAVVNMWLQAWSWAFGEESKFDKAAGIRLQSSIMELYTELVECMGAEASQQPQMREASQGLLSHSLQAGGDGNDQLAESGLRLLTSLLVNDPGGANNYKVFVPRLLDILRVGDNDAAVFHLLIHFIVMVFPHHTAFLQPILPSLIEAIEQRLQAAVLHASQATSSAPALPARRPFPHLQQRARLSSTQPRNVLTSFASLFHHSKYMIDEEVLESMDEACALLGTLLLLRVDDALLLESVKLCLSLATNKDLDNPVTDKPLSIVQKALFYNPPFYAAAIFSNAEQQETFLEASFLCVQRRYIPFSSPLEVGRSNRQERHRVASCLCRLGLANALPCMTVAPLLPRVMLVVMDAMADAPNYNKAVQALEEAVSAPEAHRDRHTFQNQQLSLQDSLYTCNLKEVGGIFVKQVINNPACVNQLPPTLLSILTRIVAENEKDNVSNGEIQNLMAQLGHTSLA